MNWYIGQDIVAIKNHVQGVFKDGDVFRIKSLKTSPCKCANIDIDIGVISGKGYNKCKTCGYTEKEPTTIHWLSERNFAPLDSLSDISELTEHLETTKPFEV